jgi:ketosteroid isomerase-like protein
MWNASEIKRANTTEEVALSYFKLLVNRDMEGFEKTWTEDALQRVLFTPEGLRTVVPSAFVGRQTIVDHYRTVTKNWREHSFWIDHIHHAHDEDCVILEAHTRSVIGETGAVYENMYVCVFHVRDREIAELKEHANPLPVMRAFAGAFESKH